MTVKKKFSKREVKNISLDGIPLPLQFVNMNNETVEIWTLNSFEGGEIPERITIGIHSPGKAENEIVFQRVQSTQKPKK